MKMLFANLRSVSGAVVVTLVASYAFFTGRLSPADDTTVPNGVLKLEGWNVGPVKQEAVSLLREETRSSPAFTSNCADLVARKLENPWIWQRIDKLLEVIPWNLVNVVAYTVWIKNLMAARKGCCPEPVKLQRSSPPRGSRSERQLNRLLLRLATDKRTSRQTTKAAYRALLARQLRQAGRPQPAVRPQLTRRYKPAG